MSGRTAETHCSQSAIWSLRDEEAAEQDLRQDERGHELHGLELRPRKRAHEEPERHPEERVGDREKHDQQVRVHGVQAEEARSPTIDTTVTWTTATAANAMP